MGGPVYRTQCSCEGEGCCTEHQELYPRQGALPEYFDGKHFFMEWGNGYIKYATFTEDGDVVDIEPFMPNTDWSQPMDMAVAADGSLYYMDWADQTISRVTHSEVPSEDDGDDGDDATGPELEPLSVPYGLNTGGHPEVAHSETPVVMDDVEYEPASDPSAIDGVKVTAANEPSQNASQRPIRETEGDALYQTEFFGQDLSIDVGLDNGFYNVKLHFAEIYWPAAGQRVFDVSIQGNKVLGDIEVVQEAGEAAGAGGDHVALTKEFKPVSVTDGTLSISTKTEADNSKFSGLAITEYDISADIRLDGQINPGWVGKKPEGISGDTNPTLSLEAGEDYVLAWTNKDGGSHNFAIYDVAGNAVVSSDIMSNRGATQIVEFTASDQMDRYECEAHPNQMSGDIQIEGGPVTASANDTESTEDGSDVTDVTDDESSVTELTDDNHDH
jgi:hypothetical protein